MTAYIQANTNGRLHDAREPSVSPLDRSFLYGDAVYEVWRTYHGVLFAWEAHCERLERSAVALRLRLPLSREDLFAQIRRTAEAFLSHPAAVRGDLYVRLQVSRGCGPIGLDSSLADAPTFVVLVQANPQWPAAKAAAGLVLSRAAALRRNPPSALNPAWKTGNYLNNLLCLQEARSRGADEVLIANLGGEVAEAAVSNIAFFRGDTLVTPPVEAGILGGITRGLVLAEVAPAAGFRVAEEPIDPDEVSAFDECCLLSTTRDVSAVARIDDVAFHVGPGSRVGRLKEAFAAHARLYAHAHPGLEIAR